MRLMKQAEANMKQLLWSFCDSWNRQRLICNSYCETSVTHKTTTEQLLFSYSSFAEASSIDRYSIRTHNVSCRLSYCRGLITGTPCSPVYLPARLHHCSEFWMLLPALWPVAHRAHMSVVLWNHYTGFQLRIGFASNLVCSCTAFTTEPVLPI